MNGKIVMVTGATNGIGKETARALARMGAKVIVVGRNREKGERVIGDIQRDTGNPNVELMLADLSLQCEIYLLAEAFKAKYDSLDVLVNNAGTLYTKREVTSEGIEKTWALNHLSYFLLTQLLLTSLGRSPAGRVVNVSSSAYTMAALNFDDLMMEKSYKPLIRYAQTKQANILFTLEMARQLQETNVTVNVLHPGISVTAKESESLFTKFSRLLFRTTPAEAAETSIYLASSPEVEGVSGRYFEQCRPKPLSKKVMDEELARKLWEASVQQTSVLAPV
jgi:NAD(P)-dependent dehydrogenase (short-subunit alcohol dehydrogenase family)